MADGIIDVGNDLVKTSGLDKAKKTDLPQLAGPIDIPKPRGTSGGGGGGQSKSDLRDRIDQLENRIDNMGDRHDPGDVFPGRDEFGISPWVFFNDGEDHGGILRSDVVEVPDNVATGDVFELEWKEDSIARTRMTGSMIEFIEVYAEGELGDAFNASLLLASLKLTGRTVDKLFRVPVSAMIPELNRRNRMYPVGRKVRSSNEKVSLEIEVDEDHAPDISESSNLVAVAYCGSGSMFRRVRKNLSK